ncbi:MAG: hypothetical protein GYB66_15650 [Chloroflexi bacterium]|nr:hypothetical protein [Chloroflexota bacterium]
MPEEPSVQRNYVWLSGVLLLAFALIAATVYLFVNEPPSTTIEIRPPLPTSTLLPTDTPAPLQVYVTGEVVDSPIALTLPPGSRVEDAIEAAGGPTDDADLEAVNLVQILQDGDMITVPPLDDEVAGLAATPTRNAPRIVNINLAGLEELQTLPGIGEKTAEAIIAYREENGPFESIDDLVNVPNIGEGTLEDLRPLITVD